MRPLTRSTCQMPDLRLVIFDVDGTLVDSQAEIVAAMTAAYTAKSLPVPERTAILSIVGLSLPQAMAQLSPTLDAGAQAVLVQAYKDAYIGLRGASAHDLSPMFPGARNVLDELRAQDHTLLAVATGKSRRGLDKVIARHGLEGYFVSAQVADFHPSKPHPAMIHQALLDTGVDATAAVMIGDTTFDMQMGRAAAVHTIGVSWGYHDVASLDADMIVHEMADLPYAIDQIWEQKNG